MDHSEDRGILPIIFENYESLLSQKDILTKILNGIHKKSKPLRFFVEALNDGSFNPKTFDMETHKLLRNIENKEHFEILCSKEHLESIKKTLLLIKENGIYFGGGLSMQFVKNLSLQENPKMVLKQYQVLFGNYPANAKLVTTEAWAWIDYLYEKRIDEYYLYNFVDKIMSVSERARNKFFSIIKQTKSYSSSWDLHLYIKRILDGDIEKNIKEEEKSRLFFGFKYYFLNNIKEYDFFLSPKSTKNLRKSYEKVLNDLEEKFFDLCEKNIDLAKEFLSELQKGWLILKENRQKNSEVIMTQEMKLQALRVFSLRFRDSLIEIQKTDTDDFFVDNEFWKSFLLEGFQIEDL